MWFKFHNYEKYQLKQEFKGVLLTQNNQVGEGIVNYLDSGLNIKKGDVVTSPFLIIIDKL